MDARTFRIDSFVRQFDRKLYARRINGMIQIWREGERSEVIPIEAEDQNYILRPNPQFILALTDNWKLSGNPVDHGLEPLGRMLRSMDAWNDDSYFDRMFKARERAEEDKSRARRNEFRAIAADSRRDFAKATNDIVVRK